MNIYSIYKATCKTTNKSYIGFDSKWPQRMWEHKCPSNYNKNYKFYNAIRKYGLNDFEWTLIYQSTDRDHCLKIMEPFFIKEYNSFRNGYNSTLGSEGVFGTKHTEKQKNNVQKPIIIYGVYYTSRKEALEKLKVSWKKLYRMEKNLPLGKKGVNNGMSKPLTIMGVSYQSKTEALEKLNIGWMLLNKIIDEKLETIPESSLKKSQNSFKGFAKSGR